MQRLELPPDLAARIAALPEGVIQPEAFGRAADLGTALRATEAAARATLAEARGVREAARAEGLTEGRAEGLRQAVEGLAAHHRGLDAIRAEQEAHVAALAFEIVEGVLGSVPEARRIGLAVRQAIRRSGVGGRVRVAAPQGAAEAVADILREGLGPGVQIEVAADPTLRPGAARLDTALGRIEVGAEEGLRVVRTALGLSQTWEEASPCAAPTGPAPRGPVAPAPEPPAPDRPPASRTTRLARDRSEAAGSPISGPTAEAPRRPPAPASAAPGLPPPVAAPRGAA